MFGSLLVICLLPLQSRAPFIMTHSARANTRFCRSFIYLCSILCHHESGDPSLCCSFSLLGWCAACRVYIYFYYDPLNRLKCNMSKCFVQTRGAPTLRSNQSFHFQSVELFFPCFTLHDVEPVLSPSLLFYFFYTSPWLLYVPAV